MISTAKRSIPAYQELAQKAKINHACDEAASNLQKLMLAVKATAAVPQSREVSEAIEQISAVMVDLEAAGFAADLGTLPKGTSQARVLQSVTHKHSQRTGPGDRLATAYSRNDVVAGEHSSGQKRS